MQQIHGRQTTPGTFHLIRPRTNRTVHLLPLPLLDPKQKGLKERMAAQTFFVLPIPISISANLLAGSRKAAHSSLSPISEFKPHRLVSSLLGYPLPISTRPTSPFRRRRTPPATTTVLSMLPTANPERTSTEKIPKWSARAIKSFGMGELEARKLKYPNTGTEALLMGILVEGTSQAAKFLRANGITLFQVREETVKLLGKSDMYFFSPEHPPLTEPAQKALDWAVDEKLKSGDSGEVTTSHMLLGIWAQEDSAGHKILASLGFDSDKANELAKSANEDAVMNYR